MTYNVDARFAPINNTLTRQEIWRMFFEPCVDEITDKPYFKCAVDPKTYDKPLFEANEIPDALCQEYVTKKHFIETTYTEPYAVVLELQKAIKTLYKEIVAAVKKERSVAIKQAKKLERDIKRAKAKRIAKEKKDAIAMAKKIAKAQKENDAKNKKYQAILQPIEKGKVTIQQVANAIKDMHKGSKIYKKLAAKKKVVKKQKAPRRSKAYAAALERQIAIANVNNKI